MKAKPHYLIILAVVVGFLINSKNVSAQEVSYNSFNFSGGYSAPIGEYASRRSSDPLAGLAGAGLFAQAAYERRLLPWFGLRLSGSLNNNLTRSQPVVTKANEQLESIRSLINETGTYTWAPTASDWNVGTVALGPAVYLHLGNLQLEGHAQAARVYIESPDVKITGASSAGTNPVFATIPRIHSGAWGFGGGVSLRIPFNKFFRFQVTADAMAAEANFSEISLIAKIGDYPEIVQRLDEVRFVGVINLGAGLAFDF